MKNIKKYRGALNLSQEELSKLTKVSRTRLSYIESDRCHSIKPEVLDSLSKVLKVSKIEILGLDNLKYLPENQEDCICLIKLLEEMMKKWD